MWFLSKIKYGYQGENGKWKSTSEQFLQEAITYGEAETQLAKFLEGRVSDYEYTIVQVKYKAVYEPFRKGAFYAVNIEEESETESGETKKFTYKHLVVADDVSDAEARARAFMKDWVVTTDVLGADITKIVGVWHPHNSAWQDDFKERMADLAAAGFESSERPADNQMKLDFASNDPNDSPTPFDTKPNPAKDMQNLADKLGATVTVSDSKRTNSRSFKPQGASK